MHSRAVHSLASPTGGRLRHACASAVGTRPPPPSSVSPRHVAATRHLAPFVRSDWSPRSTGSPSSSAASRGPPPQHRSKPGQLKSPPTISTSESHPEPLHPRLAAPLLTAYFFLETHGTSEPHAEPPPLSSCRATVTVSHPLPRIAR
jgi:hypothetical protein